MRVLSDTGVSFRSPSGTIIAHVTLVPVGLDEHPFTAPLVEADEKDAREHGETTVQLRESERYEYEVRPVDKLDLRLRCSLSSRRRSLAIELLGASSG